MVPQGPPNPLGGSQQISPSLLRSNSNLLGGQAGSQNAFGQQNQFNMNMVGNGPNVSSLLQQSFGSGGPSSQRGLIDNGADSDQLSSVGNGMGFNHSSSSCITSSNTMNSGQVQSQQDQQQAQQLDHHNFQNNQQFQAMRAGLGGLGPVKLEQQVMHDQTSQQLQALRNLGNVKVEPQQLPSMRNLATVKVEPQHSDASMFLQQQQQQLLRQSSQAAAAAQILQQQRLMQMQQHQLLKSMPQQRSPMQAQIQLQNFPIRPPVKPVYEPGMCARRLTHYMYQQQHRPEDNNIEFWRKFVAEYFAPNAKKKWCVSMYGSCRQTTGVFPQAVWHCEICNRKPGRGFEATFEVLPRLFKIKYESGTLEELLYIDMPREYQNSSGQIVLDYAKAIQESVFDQLRVVRDGQLRIVFSPDLKICSWEFCARRHEELIPRRLLIPQVGQLGAAAQKYQAATQNSSSNPASSELQNNYNMFVASARQLAKSLEVPLVNDLGYTKRYVRCLQISEVVNSMKDLIDYSRETGSGPMETLAKFPRPTNPSPGLNFQGQPQQSEAQSKQQQQQAVSHNSNNDNIQLTSTNSMPNANAPMNPGPTTSSTNTNIGLLHQNSMNSRQQNTMSGSTNHYGGNNNIHPQPNTASSFQLPTPSSSANPQQTPHGSLSGDVDTNDTQSSVQKILHDMMMSSSSHIGGGGGMNMMGSDARNGVANGNSGFGGFGQLNMVNGARHPPANNNPMTMNGRVGMMMNQPQQDLSNQLLGFSDIQFDWKSSP